MRFLWVLPAWTLASELTRGYPLFYGSFSNVGESVVESNVLPVKDVDDLITRYTTNCPADAFVLIRDSNPFQLQGLKKLQRLAENSLTRGSVLSDYMVNLHELALDLQAYCDGKVVEVLPNFSVEGIEKQIDTITRIYYLEFANDEPANRKEEVLSAVLGGIASPFVTVVYQSSFLQSNPVLRNVETNPQRLNWEKNHLKHQENQIAPIIAPLFSSHPAKTGHEAPDPVVDLPDHFFRTLLLGSVGLMAVMAYRDARRR